MTIDHLTPLYRVDLSVEKRKHFYDVFLNGDLFPTHRFPGTTGYLKIIDKPGLVPWAKNEALSHVELALLRRMNESITITEEWIKELIREAKKRPEKIRDDAAVTGTDIHAIIDKLIHGEPVEYPDEYRPAVNAFESWWKDSGIELVMGDTKIASLIYGFGGSLDALGRCDGRYIILDWKTSNGIWPEYALQVSAYRQGFFETFGLAPEEGIIVRFGKRLPITFEAKTITDLEVSFQAFLRAKELTEAMQIEHLGDSNG